MKLIDIKPNTYFFIENGDMFLKTTEVLDNKSVCISMGRGCSFSEHFDGDLEISPLKKSRSRKLNIKQVVRIEHLGRGFFRPVDVKLREHYQCKNIFAKHRDFPIPQWDNINLELNNKYWFCGYKSIDELQSWLSSNNIKWLIKKDFKVILYEVKQFQEGEYQIAFTREGVVSQKDITSLFI